jgi:hypothetical protein
MTGPRFADRQRWLRESRAIEQDERDRRSLSRHRTVLLLVAGLLLLWVLTCVAVILNS